MNEELKALLDSIEKKMQATVSKEELVKELAAIKAALAESKVDAELEAIKGRLDKLGADLTTAQKEISSTPSSIEDAVKAMFPDEKLKGLAETAEANKCLQSMSVNVDKVAAPMMTTMAPGTNYVFGVQVIPGLQRVPREEPTILNFVRKPNASAPTIAWANIKHKEGASAFIAEGELKPLIDYLIEEATSTAKKVAVRSTQSKELISDLNGIRQVIVELMREDLVDKIEDKLLTGLGGVEPTGILTSASAYTTTALDGKITAPTLADAIRAGVLQMRLLKLRPDVVFINPVEAALIDLYKAPDGHYAKIEIEGVLRTVKVRESMAVPAGHFLLLDSRRWQVKFLENINVDFGFSTGDWEKNLMSVIVEARLHSFWNDIDAGAFLYGEFATIQASLEVVVVP